MPWTAAQNKLFRAAAHNPQIARKHGLTQSKARSMAAEGIKLNGKDLARALRAHA